MKLTANEEYGLRCLIQVARRQQSGPVPIRVIADAEGLGSEHVAKLLRLLRQADLVSATRGATGGYQLTREAGQIAVSDVLSALDTPLYSDEFCTGHSGKRASCVHGGTGCSVRVLWQWVDASLQRTLQRVTLADLSGGAAPVHAALASSAPQEAP